MPSELTKVFRRQLNEYLQNRKVADFFLIESLSLRNVFNHFTSILLVFLFFSNKQFSDAWPLHGTAGDLTTGKREMVQLLGYNRRSLEPFEAMLFSTFFRQTAFPLFALKINWHHL